jgi:hypothetical protein
MQAYEFGKQIAARPEQGGWRSWPGTSSWGKWRSWRIPPTTTLPLLHAAGAVDPQEPVRLFSATYRSASIWMRSVVWG